jgi:hypothetical protein
MTTERTQGVASEMKKGNVSSVSISSDNIRVAATFTREENEALKAAAEKQSRSVSNLVAHICREWLKSQGK